MNRRTRSYLRGRFRDYYRRRPPDAIVADEGIGLPALTSREWAYIPFSEGGTHMVRHEAIADEDDLQGYLVQHRPRHVYYSTARYDDPAREPMESKGWHGADLVFDLDADHLPDVDPDTTSYADMLARCQETTASLLEIIRSDFDVEQLLVTFSGNRGFHVHVWDEAFLSLDQHGRREIVEYVRGEGLSFDAILETTMVPGPHGTSTRRELDTDSGWGARIHRELVEYCEALRSMEPDRRAEALTDIDGVGPSIAESVGTVVESRGEDIADGSIDLHPDFLRFVRRFVETRVAGSGPAIDEPVTTDVHRLIRLPGSLHGSSGLVVRPIDPDAFEAFDPLTDAIASPFTTTDIAIEVLDPQELTIGGESHTFAPGKHRVPEYLGIFLMARGEAHKVPE